MSSELALRVEGLRVRFPVRPGWLARSAGWIDAVRDLSLQVPKGKTLGLVGESGCGKSTTARAILRLLPVAAGRVWIGQQCWTDLRGRALRRARRQAQMVFQDPLASLDPRMTAGESVVEPLRAHGVGRDRRARAQQAEALLGRVGLDPGQLRRLPHELSGGQRQRVGIARALALGPTLLVADEPVSALDASVRAQILNLLCDLQQQLGIAYLFISHDLGVVRHVADEVAVMYLGRIVERAPTERLFTEPHHPYTHALLAAVPLTDPRAERARPRIILPGEVADPRHPPSGCPFHPRCAHRFGPCSSEPPGLRETATGHWVACHLESPPARPSAQEGNA